MLSCSSRLICVVREINGGSLKEVSEEGAGKKKAHAMALYIHETHRPDFGWSSAPESIRTRLLRLFRLRLQLDRKSTRLNSSHVKISYAVFCLKKKKKIIRTVAII